MSGAELRSFVIAIVLFALAACVPFLDDGYYLSLCVNIALYAALCTAWTLFSGPTNYLSLATAAFFGIGAYSVGLGIEVLPFWLLVVIGALLGGVVAALAGFLTLRLRGVYFVVLTLGMAEFIRQVVTWAQTNFTTRVGLYVFTDFTEAHIYWMLVALTAVIYLTGWLINRSRLGFAMRIIGNDETVAAHVGINTALAKVVLFVVSGIFIATVGALLAPRFAYIEPPSVFNPLISFQVVIMSLLGGTKRLWGPLVGVIPFTILFDFMNANFPNHTNILIGVVFVLVVYLIPTGIIGRIEEAAQRLRAARQAPREIEAGEHGA